MTSECAPAVFSLPPEILCHALAQATPQACAAFGRTSSRAHQIAASPALWRALHRAHFDDPPTSTLSAPRPASGPYDWAAQVQRRTRAETLLDRLVYQSEPVPPAELAVLLETLVDLAQARPPTPPHLAAAAGHDPKDGCPESDSLNERWLDRWLATTGGTGEALLALHPTFSRGSLRRNLRASTRASSGPQSPAALVHAARIAQLAAHLHVLATPAPLALASPSLRTAAREIVYEQSNFGRNSLYGPFMNDGSGRVDWRKVEALALVCMTNLDEAMSLGWGTEPRGIAANGGPGGAQGRRRGEAAAADDDDDGANDPVAPPRGWSTTRSHSGGPVRLDPEGRDWAGVTHPSGWRGTYSFLHFPVWHHFNRHRHGAIPTLAHEHEAVGDCMELKLELMPEGEWPDEIDQPDLSLEALAREDDDDEDDGDWEIGSSGNSGSSDSDMDESEGELQYFATTTAGGDMVDGEALSGVTQHDEVTPPTSTPDDSDELIKDRADIEGTDADDPPISEATLAALSAAPVLGPLPAAPHTKASMVHPAPCMTFRPSSSSSSPAASSSTTLAGPSVPYPKLAFRGTSLPRLGFMGTFTNAGPSATRPSDRSIRGTVEMTPEGNVRWQYVIRYAGSDQWAMNGVQLGGPGSRAGVVGVWTSADRAEEGPCGPFWYWPHCASNASTD